MKEILFTKEDIYKYPFVEKDITPFSYVGENMSEGWDLAKDIFKDTPIFIDKAKKYNYQECDNRIAELRFLINQKVSGEQNKIIVVCQNSVEFALMFFAITTLNDVAILLSAGASFEDIDELTKITGASLLVYADDKYDDYNKLDKLRFDAISNGKYPKVYGQPKDDCVYILTSGTTSSSKIVVYSNESLQRAIYTCGTLATTSVEGEKRKNFCVLPVSHIFGLSAGFLTALYCGASNIFSNNFLSIIEDLNYYQPLITSLVPSIIKAIIDKVSQYHINPFPSSLKLILTGGETLSPFYYQYLNEFGIKLTTAYTFTEAIGGTMYNIETVTKPDSLGIPVPYVECVIKDGELCVKAPYFASRYLDNEIVFDEEGYFHSGDLVRKDEDGFYYFEGRKGDLIKIHGQRINLFIYQNDLQKSLANKTIISYIDETLVLFYESEEDKEKEYREILKNKYPSYMQPQVLLNVPNFPLLKNGKTDIQSLNRYYQDNKQGQTNAHDDLAHRLLHLMQKAINCPSLLLDDDFFEHGGDSLSVYVVMGEFNNILLRSDMFYKYRSASRIAAAIENTKTFKEDISLENGLRLNPFQEYMVKEHTAKNDLDYNLPFLMTFNGDYTKQDIVDMVKFLLKNHPALNMVLSSTDRRLYYRPVEDLEIKVLDHSFDDVTDLVERLEMFDHPLYQLYILQNNGQLALFFNLSHLIFDGGSIDAILNDLTKFKNHEEANKDYYFEIQSHIEPEEKRKEDGVFMEELYQKHIHSCNFLPNDQNSKDVKNNYCEISFDLSNESINNLCKKYGITKQTLFIFLIALLMKNRNDKDDVSLLWQNNGHDDLCSRNSVGCFLNDNLISLSINDNDLITDVFKQTTFWIEQTYQHQHWDLEHFEHYLDIEKQVSFIQHFDRSFDDFENDDFAVHPVEVLNLCDSPNLISFQLFDISDKCILGVNANNQLFSLDIIQGWLFEINHYLSSLAKDDALKIKDIKKIFN